MPGKEQQPDTARGFQLGRKLRHGIQHGLPVGVDQCGCRKPGLAQGSGHIGGVVARVEQRREGIGIVADDQCRARLGKRVTLRRGPKKCDGNEYCHQALCAS